MQRQKTCNECDFTMKSRREMRNHKITQHEPDVFDEQSAFNNLFFDKTWKVRGMKDPMSTLQAYKPKIQNTTKYYLETKGGIKWSIGMKVIVHKINKEGKILVDNYRGSRALP